MNLPCCWTWPSDRIKGEVRTCDNRRMPDLPMCQKHMFRTFREAAYADTLPLDVWKELVRDTDVIARLQEQMWEGRLSHELAQDRRRRDEESRAEREARTHVVYYVALIGDRIKIGTTSQLVKRLKEMRVRDEDVLALERGGRLLEMDRHRQFDHLRIGRSEEFKRAPDLEQHIADTGFMLSG